MLSEAMAALAAAGGTAVVQAAGTDAWAGLRQQVASWYGQGNLQREDAELERLDRTAGELETAATVGPNEVQQVRTREEVAWQAHIVTLLEILDDPERTRAAEALNVLLAPYTDPGRVSAGEGGLAFGGNLDVRADRGSVAAGVVNGDVHIVHPPMPDPTQG